MADREWFAVETSTGVRVANQLPNIEVAKELAREAVSKSIDVLTVARYTRTEVCTMEREISIKETPPA